MWFKYFKWNSCYTGLFCSVFLLQANDKCLYLMCIVNWVTVTYTAVIIEGLCCLGKPHPAQPIIGQIRGIQNIDC